MIINDSIEVAEKLPERVGLHLGQDDEKMALARERLGPVSYTHLRAHET